MSLSLERDLNAKEHKSFGLVEKSATERPNAPKGRAKLVLGRAVKATTGAKVGIKEKARAVRSMAGPAKAAGYTPCRGLALGAEAPPIC